MPLPSPTLIPSPLLLPSPGDNGTSISIDSVTTEDVQPAVAPHRISRDAGHTTVTLKFTAYHDGQIRPSADLAPSDGTIFPDEGYYPDTDIYPDEGAIIPGVPRDTIGWTIREGGADSTTGLVVAQNIRRCSPSRVCGTRAALNPACGPEGDVRVGPGVQVTTSFTFADADDGGADGARTMNVYVLTEAQGWS